jgi:tRNA G18 (ribose-2'-O)-methylase SpoU
MARLKQTYEYDGFFGIGIANNVTGLNIGTLWRTAHILGAAFIFTVGKRYSPESSDVTKAWNKIPLYHYKTADELKAALPYSTPLIGVELTETATPIETFEHPHRAVYLLGNERSGLPERVLALCNDVIKLPGNFSLNVAVAGSIVIYDRVAKLGGKLPA